ncbi:MAG TPA: HAD-IA family hydrolase [Bryobacteraceae bacterium]|jgi:HAD superfamily phosphatase|nr:HAD-IA family hydrolase [Bryobacteraceae bacterium]
MPSKFVVFDMDGVLVDVSESYRETIQRTVQHFTGREVTREDIQEWKNRGGWNDDWALSTAMIRDNGVNADYNEVVNYFQNLFHGDGSDGLILRERWIAQEGMLQRLNEKYGFALFTGRFRWEAELTLNRFAAGLLFEPIIGAGDVPNHKPAPDGLLRIGRITNGAELWYVGDTVDDARSAKAANVPFIGVAAAGGTRRQELIRLFKEEGAKAIIEDINQLEDALIL